MDKNDILWRDRKRPIFGLPLSFTVYKLTGKKLLIETGFLNKHREEILLYRIIDKSVHKSLFQRIFGVGTIKCYSSDKSTPEIYIQDIKNPDKVDDLLSDEVERERKENRISPREIMYNGDYDSDN